MTRPFCRAAASDISIHKRPGEIQTFDIFAPIDASRRMVTLVGDDRLEAFVSDLKREFPDSLVVYYD